MHSSIELPPLRDHFKQEPLPPFQSSRPRELLPSILSHSPPGRSSTLPPLQRNNSKIQRPRKSSITQNARKPKHDRTRSKEFARRPSLGDRKALSAEPQTAAWVQGKRWEDLIEAATSATEVDEDRDTTPVCWLHLASVLHANVVGTAFSVNVNAAQQYILDCVDQKSQLTASVIALVKSCANSSVVSRFILHRVSIAKIAHTTTAGTTPQPR